MSLLEINTVSRLEFGHEYTRNMIAAILLSVWSRNDAFDRLWKDSVIFHYLPFSHCGDGDGDGDEDGYENFTSVTT